jgi:hypothetical protein
VELLLHEIAPKPEVNRLHPHFPKTVIAIDRFFPMEINFIFIHPGLPQAMFHPVEERP